MKVTLARILTSYLGQFPTSANVSLGKMVSSSSHHSLPLLALQQRKRPRKTRPLSLTKVSLLLTAAVISPDRSFCEGRSLEELLVMESLRPTNSKTKVMVNRRIRSRRNAPSYSRFSVPHLLWVSIGPIAVFILQGLRTVNAWTSQLPTSTSVKLTRASLSVGGHPLRPFSTQVHMIPDPLSSFTDVTFDMTLDTWSSSLLTSFETFDGSQVDPVVVSNVFWAGLKAKLLSLIIGQILSIVVFSIISTIAAQQIKNLADYVAEKFSDAKSQVADSSTRGQTFRKMPSQMSSPKPPINLDIGKLAICILIDTIGTSSELLPVIGEVTDVVWAPIAALLLRNLYGGNNVIFVLELLEEILPFTDVLPLATLCWVVETFFTESSAAKLLQVGEFDKTLNVAEDSSGRNQSRMATSSKDKGVIIDVENISER